MKIFRSSALAVSFIQLTSTALAIAGIYFYGFGIVEIFTACFFYFIYCGLGIGMMYHRYFSHKSFEFKNRYVKNLFILFSLLAGRGSPIGWVHVHREHHAFSDTDRDPHSPKYKSWRILFPHLLHLGENFNIKLVKDLLSKSHRQINNYYMLIVLTYVVVLSLINPWLTIFVWAVPVALTAWMMDISTISNHTLGYTNFATSDNSKNNPVFGYLMFGEGWHNNHHKHAASVSNKVRWWEFDLISVVIHFVKK